jgi:hypothetical protein
MTNTLWDPNIGNVANPTLASATINSLTAPILTVTALTAPTLTVGSVIDSASGIAGKTDFQQRLSLPVTAVTNTDYTMSVPVGATIMTIWVYTTTAYTGTTANISIGSAAAGAQYVAATDIHAVGIVQLTFAAGGTAGLLSMPAGTPNLFIRIAQSTTPTAVGAATLVVDYTQA